MRLYDVFRARRGMEASSTMRYVEITNDFLQSGFLNFCNWVSSTPIPAYFDENLQPPRAGVNQDDATRLLVPTTLVKYIGKVLSEIRIKFPEHPDFDRLSTTDVPLWWSAMRPLFVTNCTRYHMLLGSDYTFGDTTSRPLYADNGLTSNDGEAAINDYVSLIDLKCIQRKLMKDVAGP
jgi:hypothetical protein